MRKFLSEDPGVWKYTYMSLSKLSKLSEKDQVVNTVGHANHMVSVAPQLCLVLTIRIGV